MHSLQWNATKARKSYKSYNLVYIQSKDKHDLAPRCRKFDIRRGYRFGSNVSFGVSSLTNARLPIGEISVCMFNNLVSCYSGQITNRLFPTSGCQFSRYFPDYELFEICNLLSFIYNVGVLMCIRSRELVTFFFSMSTCIYVSNMRLLFFVTMY